jgi:sulfur relay (sulfurtransferase) complex TusBCD TusD component (DsrE family)
LKTLIELLIAALVLHGCVTMGGAVWRNFTFKDAVEQETRFAGTAPTEALHQRIMELAEAHEVPLEPVNVVVERRGVETVVATKYTETVPLAFGFYPREHLFEFEVRARVLTVDKVR